MGGGIWCVAFVAFLSFSHALWIKDPAGEDLLDAGALVQAGVEAGDDVNDWRHQKVPRSILKGQIQMPTLPSWVGGIGSKLGILAEQSLTSKLNALGESVKNTAETKLYNMEMRAQDRSTHFLEKLDHKLDALLNPMAAVSANVAPQTANVIPEIPNTIPSSAPVDVAISTPSLSAPSPVAAVSHAAIPKQILPLDMPPLKINPKAQAKLSTGPAYSAHDSPAMKFAPIASSINPTPPTPVVNEAHMAAPAVTFGQPAVGLANGVAQKVLADATPLFDLKTAQRKLDEAFKTKIENTMSSAAEMAGSAVARFTGVSPESIIQHSPDGKIDFSTATHTLDSAFALGVEGMENAGVRFANNVVSKLSNQILRLPTEKLSRAAVGTASGFMKKMEKLSNFMADTQQSAITVQTPTAAPPS